MAEIPEPTVKAIEYTVNCVPEDGDESHLFEIRVHYRGTNRWAVTRFDSCLGTDGTWAQGIKAYGRGDQWLNDHRFDLDTALNLAKQAAPHVTAHTCPTPHKKRYATQTGAEKAAHRSRISINKPLYPYVCICTWWHLSKTATPLVPDGTTADPANTTRLQGLSAPTFRAVVVDEVSGRTPMPDRIALRHPLVAPRWAKYLRELLRDAEQQLAARAHDTSLEAHAWRTRTHSYRDTLTLRLREAQDIHAHHPAETAAYLRAAHAAQVKQQRQEQQTLKQARKELRDASLDRTLAAHEPAVRIQDKEARRLAGDAAIKRLIEAHYSEFGRYLADECTRLGASIPKRVRQHLDADLPHTA